MSELLEHKTALASKTRLARFVNSLGGEKFVLLAGRLLYRLKITGQEHIPETGACLFAFNHVSIITDLFTQVVIRQRRPAYHLFSVQELRGNNPVAHALAGIGNEAALERLLLAYKARGLSAASLLKSYNLLLEGQSIALAAEGEMTWDGRLQYPLAPGAAWLALRTAVPVIPIVSVGGYDIQPRWQWKKMRFWGRIEIRVGTPIQICDAPITRFSSALLNNANDLIWKTMANLLE